MVPLPVCDNTVNRAAVGTIHPFDIDWSEKIFDDDAFSQSLDTTALHFIEAALFQSDVVFMGDIRSLTKWWDMWKDLDIVGTFRCLS